MSFQFPQAIRQNVRRDSCQEFLAGSESPQHHVADNRERPAIAQYLHGSVQRTARPPLGTGLLLAHSSTLVYFHLHLTSKMGTLLWFAQAMLSRAYKE